MNFFLNPEVQLSAKLLEIIFIVIGLILVYAGIKNYTEKENEAKLGTCVFWVTLGIVIMLGRWIPSSVVGALVLLMAVPAVIQKVKPGCTYAPAKAYTEKMASIIGYKIFIPALAIGFFAVGFALFTKLGALVGVGVGVLVSATMLMVLNKDNTFDIFLKDNKRLLDLMGPLCMLPMFLASLGAVFTASGVGHVVAGMWGISFLKEMSIWALSFLALVWHCLP